MAKMTAPAKATLASLRIWYDQCERAIESAEETEANATSDSAIDKAGRRGEAWRNLQQAIDDAIAELEDINGGN